MKRLIQFTFVCAGLMLAGCGSPSPTGKDESDTPTSGKLRIAVDESYRLIFENQVYTFEKLYKNAKVEVSYKPEAAAIADLFSDSCKVVVMNRDLTKNEYEQFKTKKIFPKATKVAEDAIAIIVNNENPDTLLTVDRIKSILLGLDSSWKQINPKSPLGAIKVVFDNEGSANTRYMRDSLLAGKKFAPYCFALKTNPEVVEYVSQHKGAVGIIGVSYISDRDDTLSQSFLKKIKVVGLTASAAPNARYYRPYQAYIKTKDYPICRDVYMINRQTRAGLGMGFVSFVAGEKGQRMILKQGLVPATAPVRLVQINTKPLK